MQRGLPEGDRSRGMSLLFVGMALGGMLAPPIANGIAIRFGWRAAFLGTAALAAAWAPLWLSITSRPRVRAVLDDAGDTEARPSMLKTASHLAMIRGLIGLLAIVPASAFAMAWESKFYVRQFGLTQKGLTGYLVASAVAYDVARYSVRRPRGEARAPARPRLARPPRALLACGALLAVTGLAGLAVDVQPARRSSAWVHRERRGARCGRDPLQHGHARARASASGVDGRAASSLRCSRSARSRDQPDPRPRRARATGTAPRSRSSPRGPFPARLRGSLMPATPAARAPAGAALEG